MKIAKIELFKLNTPLIEPFVIAIETITNAESIVVKMTTENDLIGWGECNPYRSIAGETQGTAFEAGQFLAKILRGQNATAINSCIRLMDKMLAGNRCIKSAFDMALYDIAAKAANLPLYQFLGGENNRSVTTDMTVGIGSPVQMAASAFRFKNQGFPAIKVKLGTTLKDDVARIRAIRDTIGDRLPLRIDANQGWDEATAIATLKALERFDIEHCEQPIAARNIAGLARVKAASPIPIMADEAVFDHFDALGLVQHAACDYFNIKLAKSGGLYNALKINAIAEAANLKCQVGCFSETRLAMSALMHFILACPNVVHFDLDAPLMLSADPVLGGLVYGENGSVFIDDAIGIGASFDDDFLKECTRYEV
ncbi:MAG: dipeptide epimerase [Saprospiraceae bacterium]|nr:dipeptide epimerase [Saprospiraceae bacterium]